MTILENTKNFSQKLKTKLGRFVPSIVKKNLNEAIFILSSILALIGATIFKQREILVLASFGIAFSCRSFAKWPALKNDLYHLMNLPPITGRRFLGNLFSFSFCIVALVINLYSLKYYATKNETYFLIYWCISLGMIIISFGLSFARLFVVAAKHICSRDFCAIILLTLLAAILRLVPMKSFALGHFEAVWGIGAMEVINWKMLSPFNWIGDFPSNFPSYVIALSQKYFEPDFLLGNRIGLGLLGILSVPLIYAITKLITESFLSAYFCAAMFTTSVWMVNESIFSCNFALYIFIQLIFLLGLVISTSFSGRIKENSSNADNYLGCAKAGIVISGIAAGLLFDIMYLQSTTVLCLAISVFFAWAVYRPKNIKNSQGLFYIFIFSFSLTIIPTIYRVYLQPDFVLSRHIGVYKSVKTHSLSEFFNFLSHFFNTFNFHFLFSNLKEYTGAKEVPLGYVADYFFPVILGVAFNLFFFVGFILTLLNVRYSFYFLINLLFFAMFVAYLVGPESYYRVHATAPFCFIYAAIGIFAVGAKILTYESKPIRKNFLLFIFYLLGITQFLGDFHHLQLAYAEKIKKDKAESPRGALTLMLEKMGKVLPCNFYISGTIGIANAVTDFGGQYYGVPIVKIFKLEDLPEKSISDQKQCVLWFDSPEEVSAKAIKELLQARYPNGKYEALKSSFWEAGGVNYFEIPKSDQASLNENIAVHPGVRVEWFSDKNQKIRELCSYSFTDIRGALEYDNRVPLRDIFEIDKSAIYIAPSSGTYEFKVNSTMDVEILMDDKPFINLSPTVDNKAQEKIYLEAQTQHNVKLKLKKVQPGQAQLTYFKVLEPGSSTYEDLTITSDPFCANAQQ